MFKKLDDDLNKFLTGFILLVSGLSVLSLLAYITIRFPYVFLIIPILIGVFIIAEFCYKLGDFFVEDRKANVMADEFLKKVDRKI